MTNGEIIDKAVIKAQEVARSKGFSIRQVVAHPNDEFIYNLLGIDGNVATVGIPAAQSPGGIEIRKTFPLNELFDPNVARDLAVGITIAELATFNPN